MIITLTTDFGLTDPFAGIMKGVILGIAPGARLVDITHNVPSYDVSEAAFIVESAYRHFPPGTIHVVVVDPGVGSPRRPIAAAVNEHVFVAPDNGVLSLVFHSGAKGSGALAHHITNTRLFNTVVSNTFHGRDVFAPVAAHLACGIPLESVGPRIDDCKKDAVPQLRRSPKNSFIATVLRIDKFGNVITNILPEDLDGRFSIRLAGAEVRRLLPNYAEANRGEIFFIKGSTGYIELSLNQGSAAERFGLCRGAEIEVETGEANH